MVSRVAAEQSSVLEISRTKSGFDACEPDNISWMAALRPGDTIVNCVAVTRANPTTVTELERVYKTNAWFPQLLARASSARKLKLIHISTDAVFASREEPYGEAELPNALDWYGLSKTLGEVHFDNALNIRCSIVGPEAAPRGHLLGWLLAHQDGASVNGYTNHMWHGATTLQLARLCVSLSEDSVFPALRSLTDTIHFTPNEPISKFDLLREMNAVSRRKICINPVTADDGRVRILQSKYNQMVGFEPNGLSMKEALTELFNYLSLAERNQNRESNVNLRNAP